MKTLLLMLLGLTANASLDTSWEFVFSTTAIPLSSVTTTSDAKKSFIGEIYNPLGFKYNFMPYSIQLTTSKISLISNKDKDGGLSTNLTQLEGGYVFTPSSNLHWKSQLGIMVYEMKGSGGQTVLRNGLSTATFDLPNRTTRSQLLYTGVGTEYDFGSGNIDFDLNFLSLLSNARRSYFISITLGVPL